MEAYEDLATEFGIPPFHYICMKAHVDAIRAVLSQKIVDVNQVTNQDVPIHYAVLSKNRQVVDILLAAGADLNKEDAWGMNALHVASTDENGDPEFVKFLIDRGAAGVRGKYQYNVGGTILHAICYCAKVNPAVIKVLIAAGADVNEVDSNYRTPLHIACRTTYVNVKVIEILVDAGADIYALDIHGRTCMDYAETRRHYGVIAYLDQFGGGKTLKSAAK